MLKDGIETIPGKTNPHVLLIAPHGYPDPDNDENTGALVGEMQKILDCPVIINDTFRKTIMRLRLMSRISRHSVSELRCSKACLNE